jgi:hypothetical protein
MNIPSPSALAYMNGRDCSHSDGDCTYPDCFCKSKGTPTPAAAGQKFDLSKTDLSLISPLALAYLSRVLDFGAKKYAPHNWRKGIDQSRLISAALRHILAYNAGENLDLETGLPHMAHAMCCCMFALEQSYTANNPDSRHKLSVEQRTLLVSLLAGETPSRIE